MTAAFATAAPDVKTALRLPQDRSAAPGDARAASAFLMALEEQSSGGVKEDAGYPVAEETGADDESTVMKSVPLQLDAPLQQALPHILLAAHRHDAVIWHSGRDVLLPSAAPAFAASEMVAPDERHAEESPRQVAQEMRTARVYSQAESMDSETPMQPAGAEVPTAQSGPGPELKPEIITALSPREAKTAIRDLREPRQGLQESHDMKRPEQQAIAATETQEIDPLPQPGGPSPQPQSPLPATQVVAKLEPAINQAQAILRILETAGGHGPVVRTLQFGLRPSDLGEVRIIMSLTGDRLDLRIETQTAEAARRLEFDRGLLDTMLMQTGITVERGQIDIRLGRFEPVPQATGFEGPGLRGSGEQAGTFSHGERRHGGSPQGNKDQSHASSPGPALVERNSSGVYL